MRDLGTWAGDRWHLGAYRDLLLALASSGRTFVSFDEVTPTDPVIVLRHDVDFDTSAAVRIAEVEADLGLRSTFLFLVRSDCYNVTSEVNSAAIARVGSLGHTIGLHLDARLYDTAEQLEAGARAEIALLEMCTRTTVEAISFHRPSPELIGADGFIGLALPHTYERRFVQDIGYCSDSGGSWRFGEPMTHKAIVEGTALQLLTHPIWWAGPSPRTALETLDGYLARSATQLSDDLAKNCRTYRDGRSIQV